jgi:hypothetical protein
MLQDMERYLWEENYGRREYGMCDCRIEGMVLR